VECCLNPKWFNYFWASPKWPGQAITPMVVNARSNPFRTNPQANFAASNPSGRTPRGLIIG